MFVSLCPLLQAAYFLSAIALLTGMLDVDPSQRMTISDIADHPWCMRPSQLAGSGPMALADKLTEGLRANGDLELASPNFGEEYVFATMYLPFN